MISYKDLSQHDYDHLLRENNGFKEQKDQEKVEHGLTVIGVFGIMDPLRPGIADAVDACHKAGVNVRMCTGDNILTAIAISKEAHILSERDLADTEDKDLVCMTGKDFQEYIGGLQEVKNEDGTSV